MRNKLKIIASSFLAIALTLLAQSAIAAPLAGTGYAKSMYCKHIRFYYSMSDAARIGNMNGANNTETNWFAGIPHQDVTGVSNELIREIIHRVFTDPEYQNPDPEKEGIIAEAVCVGLLPETTSYAAITLSDH